MALTTAHVLQNPASVHATVAPAGKTLMTTESSDTATSPVRAARIEAVSCERFLELMLSRLNLARFDLPKQYGLLDESSGIHFVVSMIEFDTWRDTGADS